MLLAQHHDVMALDIIQKIDLLNDKISPIVGNEIEHFLKEKTLNFYFYYPFSTRMSFNENELRATSSVICSVFHHLMLL